MKIKIGKPMLKALLLCPVTMFATWFLVYLSFRGMIEIEIR